MDEKNVGAGKAAAAPKSAVMPPTAPMADRKTTRIVNATSGGHAIKVEGPKKLASAWAAEKGVGDWLLAAAGTYARLTNTAWKTVDQTPCAVCERTCEPSECDCADKCATPRRPHACLNVARTDAWSVANAWMTTPITETEFDAAVERAR